MILINLLTILSVASVLAWFSERFGNSWPRWISLLALLLSLFLLWAQVDVPQENSAFVPVSESAQWWVHLSFAWIERFGIRFTLGIDGLSYLLLMLTLALGVFSVLCSWSEITHRVGFFYCNLLLTLVGIVGVFCALDLFLFFCFWEVMLIPMVLLISIWGHEKRAYAATKFFIFTQASSLLMLISIVTLALMQARVSGVISFDYAVLRDFPVDYFPSIFLMLGFFVAFAVKIPMIPVHSWLPDAHTQAPTAGSVILAALLLKTGAYGLIRFTLPLFPEASLQFAPVAMTLAVLGILYGAKLAFAQNDLKRFIAYSSISHMGFVVLGIYAMSVVALQGAILQMVAHGISTAALFMLAGMLQERLHTRDLNVIGGLSAAMPRLAAFGLFFSVASLGLPGLANFAAEFLVLLGSFATQPVFTVLAALGLVAGAIYSLALLQRVFWGKEKKPFNYIYLSDLNRRESGSLLVL
ncbi:MAG: NADH-quinone oxidoreductase subunit M, partial [Spongiibacteraceae bacterium]|nr:NADH-quinone oxidoreductase subunit M [Spongiibacteraceae bacterium]